MKSRSQTLLLALTVQLEARTTPEVDAIPGAREILQALADLEETELEEESKDYSIIPVVNLGHSSLFPSGSSLA